MSTLAVASQPFSAKICHRIFTFRQQHPHPAFTPRRHTVARLPLAQPAQEGNLTMTLSITPLSSRRLIAAVSLALLAGGAIAQATAPAPTPAASGAQPHPMGPGGMHERHGRFGRPQDAAAMQKRFDQRMTALKQSLQLTPAQEPAWTEFSSAMRPPATPPQMPDRAAMEKMTTPQRLDQMQALRKQHLSRMEQREAATRAFYARLSPEQQKRFDDHTRRMGPGHDNAQDGHHGHEEHGGHRHHS